MNAICGTWNRVALNHQNSKYGLHRSDDHRRKIHQEAISAYVALSSTATTVVMIGGTTG